MTGNMKTLKPSIKIRLGCQIVEKSRVYDAPKIIKGIDIGNMIKLITAPAFSRPVNNAEMLVTRILNAAAPADTPIAI